MKIQLRFLFVALSLGINILAHSQTTTDTIYFAADGIDSDVFSGATTTNYGTATTAKVYSDYGSPTRVYRTHGQSHHPHDTL